MVEEIARGLYRLEIPLPNSPLRSLNSYVIKGSGRNLIIDTGLNMRVCQEAMQNGLKEIGIDLRETDFFITHFHADHTGLVPCLVTDTSKIFFNRPEVGNFRGKAFWEKASQYADMMGFPEDELTAAVQNHPAVKHGGGWQPEVELLKDGDQIGRAHV
jgi:glyoxylase-like metal-dependent hydrolase (beta-lactamase superfamily II)